MSQVFLRQAAGARFSSPPFVIGANSTPTDFASTSMIINVPSGTQFGDTLIVVLRCRADRTITIPAEWTIETNGVVLGSSGPTTNTLLYIAHKPYAGESSVSFAHSATGAALGVVVSVRGTMGGVTKTVGAAVSRAPSDRRSLMLALGTSSGATATSATWLAPFASFGSYKWGDVTPYFYGVTLATHYSGGLGSVTASYTWSGNAGSNYAWLAEILPLS